MRIVCITQKSDKSAIAGAMARVKVKIWYQIKIFFDKRYFFR